MPYFQEGARHDRLPHSLKFQFTLHTAVTPFYCGVNSDRTSKKTHTLSSSMRFLIILETWKKLILKDKGRVIQFLLEYFAHSSSFECPDGNLYNNLRWPANEDVGDYTPQSVPPHQCRRGGMKGLDGLVEKFEPEPRIGCTACASSHRATTPHSEKIKHLIKVFSYKYSFMPNYVQVFTKWIMCNKNSCIIFVFVFSANRITP